MRVNYNNFLPISRNLATGLLSLMLCTACSSEPKELPLEPASAAITGEMGEYVEVVPGMYTISSSDKYGAALETRIKVRIKKALPANKEAESLSLDILNGNTMPVAGLKKFEVDGFKAYNELESLNSLLRTGTGEIILPFYMGGNKDDAAESVEAHQVEAKKFAVAGMLRDKAKEEAASTSASTENSSDPEDCDKFLTDFEKYVGSYAALANKMAKNPADLSLMTEYTAMATKAQEMQQDKPDACATDAAFMKRYTCIMAKMTKAAAVQTAGMANQAASAAKLMEQMGK